MLQETCVPVMTVEEYIEYELQSERRHEYINGQLYEMPGEKKKNNRFVFKFAMAFTNGLSADYFVYNHDVKVGVPGGKKYYYPDVVATLEPEGEGVHQYVVYHPVIIVEVVSGMTKSNDYGMKLRDYTVIPELQYYLIAEPEPMLVTVYERSGEEWIARRFTQRDEMISLPKLGLELAVAQLYA